MAFLVKGKREDLLNLGSYLGLEISADQNVKEIRAAIIACEDFSEKEHKELLAEIIESRKSVEKEEKERKQKQEEEARLFARESEIQRFELEKLEKEKALQNEFELAKLAKEQELELAKQEKEKELELARQEKEIEMARIAAEVERLRIESPRDGNTEPRKSMPYSFQRYDIHQDMSVFIEMFEQQASKIPKEEWVQILTGLLPLEIWTIWLQEMGDTDGSYEALKGVLLKKFKLTAEKFRQLLRRHQKSMEQTWTSYYYELRTYFRGWLEGLKVDTFDGVCDLVLVEEIKRRIPQNFKEHYVDEWSQITCPKTLAEKIESYEDNIKAIQPRFYGNHTNKGKYHQPTNNHPKSNSSSDHQKKNGKDKNSNKVEKKSYESDKKPYRNFDDRKSDYKPRPKVCYTCGLEGHISPICPNKKQDRVGHVINIEDPKEHIFLDEFTGPGTVNGVKCRVLRDTGATIDLAGKDCVSNEDITGDNTLIRRPGDDILICLPIANIILECRAGRCVTKAAVSSAEGDKGKYLMSNRTARLFKNNDEIHLPAEAELVNMVVTRQQKREEQRLQEDNPDTQPEEIANQSEEIPPEVELMKENCEEFTAIDPAKRHAELQKRFGLPVNDMYVESANPEIMGGFRESSSVGNSPRLQHRVPVFNSSYDQEKLAQNVDSGHKPRVRVIPIQVEGVDAPMKRNRTFSGPAGSVKEVDPRQPSVFKSHVQNELPTNESVKRPSKTRVCNIPVQIEPRAEKVAEKPKFEKNIEVNKVPSTVPKPEIVNSKLPETNGCAASKVEDKSAEPDLNVPLKQIDAVLNKLKTYREEVEKFSESSKDKQYRYLDEMLTRCMLDLHVETFGMDNIRQSRKAAIRQVQSCIDLLDTKVNAQTLQSNDVSMSDSTTDTEFSKLEDNSEPVIEEANEEKFSERTTAEEGSEVITEKSSEPIIEEVQEDLSNSSAVEMCDKTESVVQEMNPNSVVEEFIAENLNVDPSVESAPLVQEVEDSVSFNCDSVSGVEISDVVNCGVSELNSCVDVEMEEQPLLKNTTATVKELNEEMEVSVSSEQETVIPTNSELPLIVEPSDSLDIKQPCDSSYEQCLMEPDFSIKYPRLTRWALALQPFTFEIKHRSGTKNKNADALSRYEQEPLGKEIKGSSNFKD